MTLFVPPKPPRNKELRGSEYEPRPTDSQAVKDWRARMGSEEGKEVYKQRAATSETANAELKSRCGMSRMLVRGLNKTRCVALWFHEGVVYVRDVGTGQKRREYDAPQGRGARGILTQVVGAASPDRRW